MNQCEITIFFKPGYFKNSKPKKIFSINSLLLLYKSYYINIKSKGYSIELKNVYSIFIIRWMEIGKIFQFKLIPGIRESNVL